MAKNKKVEILSNSQEVLHPMTDGDCVIFEDGQTLTQKLSEDDSVKYTPEIVNSSPMFKVGEGNTVDYSDNVLDGAYERATLQGQTYVNYIQESSADEVTLPTPFTEYERTQHNTLTSDEEGTLGINLVGQSYVNALQHDSEEEYVVLGESLEFQEKKVEYTNEGQIKSAILKGQTLVNLSVSSGYKTVTLTPTQEYIPDFQNNVEMYKPNTKYLVITEFNHDYKYRFAVNSTHTTTIFSENAYIQDGVGKVYKHILTTRSDFTGCDTALRTVVYNNTEETDFSQTYRIMVIEYQEGMENWDIPYFEGMQSVTVSTKLENLCHKHTTSDLAKNGKTFNTNSLSDRCITLVDYKDSAEATYGMKPNTKYLVQFKISNLVLDGLSSLTMAFSVGEPGTTNCLFKDGTKTGLVTANGVYRVVLTTTDVVSTSGVEIKGIANEWENSGSTLRSLKISNIMYVEYQNGMENWTLPYFEDYQVMQPVQVESINKNLFDGQLESGNIDSITGAYVASAERQRTVNFIPIKPNTTYIFSNNRAVTFGVREYDNNKNYLGWYAPATSLDTYTALFTTKNSDVAFLKFIIVDTNTDNQIQLEESDTATEYVPHQSKTTYSWDEVILRKIGDVEDTLDLTTGEWIQRIGEIDFHDYSYVQINTDRSNDTYTNITRPILDAKKGSPTYPEILCNKFSTVGHESYIAQPNIVYMDWGYINITVPNSSLGDTITENGCLQWLQDNNIVIQYPLATPIVHKVNLSRPNLQVYDDITHVHTKCLDGTLIPNIYLPSDISYPAILEPGKNYNICVNHTQVSADNPLKVNVGGTEITMTDSRMTLTTPATLANSNVSFTGKGNKIKESMLIKNSSLLTRDLPHFNGIGSVHLGKTIENLCSSRYIKGGSAQATLTDALDTVKITTTTQGSYVLEFPILTPLENGKTYFVYAPVSGGWANYSFVRTYNNSKSYLRQPMGDMMNPQQYIVTIDQLDNQYASLCIGCHGAIGVGTTYTITRPILCEYEPGMENWDWESIGYFTGTKNIGNEFMKVQNKNLIDVSKIVKGVTYNHGGFSEISEYGGRLTLRQKDAILVKPNSVYSVSISPSDFTMGYYLLDEDKNIIYDSGWIANPVSFLIDRPNAKYLIFNLKKQSGEEIEVSDVTSIQLEESSTATTHTAHKHNGLYITKDQPIELTWEQGAIFYESGVSWSQMTNNVNSMRIRTPQPLTLEPNKTYRVSLGSDKYQYGIQLYDNSNNGAFDYGWNTNREFIFTTTKDKHKVSIAVGKIDSSNSTPITPSESVHVQIRLEEVTNVILRGIGSVHDELDITRGIYTQRINEIVLDGSENWSSDTNGSGATRFYNSLCNDMYIEYGTVSSSANLICNNFNHPIGNIYTDTNNSIQVVIPNGLYFICTECSTVDEWRTWLKNNKTIIQYALSTPIIHKVHIGNKNETNTEITKPNDVFTLPTLYTEQTHIDLTNNGIMPKVQSRDYIVYPVSPMINRTYTLQHNLTGGVSNLTVDLLGRTQSVSYQNHKSLIYSPETMDAKLHDELRISGKGKISKVMYIDGGYMDRDIPYIEGMKNAVNPIVKNIGKNLISFDNVYSSYITNGSLSCVNNTITKLKDGYNDMQLFIYLINGKHYYFGLDGSIGVGGVQQPKIVFGKMYGWKGLAEQQKVAPNQDFIYRGQTGWTTLHMVNIDYINNIYITEVQSHENCEPYKENICYVDCGEIRLTPDMFEQGSITVHVNNIGKPYTVGLNSDKARIRTKKPINIEPNEQYVIIGNTDKYGYSLHFLDKDENYIGVKAPYELSWGGHKPFTVASDSPKALMFIKRMDNSTITPNDVDVFNFQLVKVSEIKQLRSLPHGVHDEIDLETGKYIQRVGEITFNGTESWIVGYAAWQNKYTYYNNGFVDIKTMKGDNGSGQAYYDAVRCPQLHRSYMSRLASASIDGVCSYYYSGYQRIFVSKQDCATVDELKLWLQENPITVQYELPEPIVKDIVIHNYPHSYEGGHVIIENGDPNTPIPAQLTYRAVTNRSGQIQQHTEQVEKQEREINELETLILANIHLSQTR